MTTTEMMRLSVLLNQLYDKAIDLRSSFLLHYSNPRVCAINVHATLDAIERITRAIRDATPIPPKATP